MTNILKHNIIVVEDSPTMQHLIKAHLGFYEGIKELDLKMYTHVQPAKDYLENTIDEVHLIICDIMLPGEYSGLDFLRYVRKDQRFYSIPFIVITVNTDKTIKHKCHELNCSGFLYKPFTIPQIHDLLKQWLKTEY